MLKTIILTGLLGFIFTAFSLNVNFCPNKKKKKATSEVIDNQNNYWTYIEKNQWKLIQLDGNPIKEGDINIKFNIKDQNCNGMGVCNRFSGNYKTQNDQITFGPLISTEMACFNNSKLEFDFFNTLSEGVFTFDVADQTLNFYRNHQLVMMFGMSM
jgi:heat shock protein HslJ